MTASLSEANVPECRLAAMPWVTAQRELVVHTRIANQRARPSAETSGTVASALAAGQHSSPCGAARAATK